MKFRHATATDAESIALLHAESWRFTYRGVLRDEFLDDSVVVDRRTVWQQRFAAPKSNQCVLVAEGDGRLCGFVCAFGNEDPSWGTFIDNLHVRPDLKRQGLGKDLMREIGGWSQQNYPDAGMYLLVADANMAARRFYEALGSVNQAPILWDAPDGSRVAAFRYVWRMPLANLLAEQFPNRF